MTDQPDLKARLRRAAAICPWRAGQPAPMLNEAADRITDLEAERDELAEQVSDLERDAEIVSSEFEKDCWRAVRSLLIKVGHDDFSEGVTADLACEIISDAISEAEARAQAAEARLDLADRLAEATRAFAKIAGPIKGEVGRPTYLDVITENGGTEELAVTTIFDTGGRGAILWADDFRTLSAALTAYAENTSSKDLTTGEDDA